MKRQVKSHLMVNIIGICLLVCMCLNPAARAGVVSENTSSQTLRSMARVYMAFGQYDRAEGLAQKALDKAQAEKAGESEIAMCLIDLGTLYQYEGRLEDAEEILNKGIAMQNNSRQENPYLPHTLRMLSSVYRRQHRYDKAQATLDEAMNLLMQTHQADDAAVAIFLTEQAKLFTEQFQLAQAEEIYRKAFEQIRSAYGDNHLCTANVLEEMANLDLLSGRADLADTRIDDCIRIRTRYYGNVHHSLVSAWLTKARVARTKGDSAGMEEHIHRALQAAEKIKNIVKLASLHQEISQIRSDVRLAKL